MAPPRTSRDNPSERFERFVAEATANAHRDESATEANKVLVERYFEMWNTGDGFVADAVLGPTYLDHAHPEVIGPAALRSLVPRFHAANPEARLRIEIAAADDEFVAVRKTMSRMSGGQPIESVGVALFRVIAGKLAEQWSAYANATDEAPTSGASPLDDWLWRRA